jgi:DNA repair exonuclease SbcCD ATPase subunit
MAEIKELRNRLEQLKGEKNQLLTQIKQYRQQLRELKQQIIQYEKAREIIREVGLKTQQQLQYHISDITSLALEAVFDDPYTLKVEFVQRRNKTECDLLFVRNGKEIDPLEASGYGAVDIAAFALRVASWSMKTPKTRNTIILDEPMLSLSEDRQPLASRMLKEISERLGIQFIIVTHKELLTEYADKIFSVSKGLSEVSSIKTKEIV